MNKPTTPTHETVWVLTDENYCERFCDQPTQLEEDRELCTIPPGCTFCEEDDEVAGRSGVVAVFKAAEAAIVYLQKYIDGRERLATVEWKSSDGQTVGYWVHLKDEKGESGSHRYQIQRHLVH